MKKRIVLGFLLAVAVLGLLVRSVGTQAVIAEAATADLRLFALGFLSTALSLTFRGGVWIRLLGMVDAAFDRLRIATVFLAAMFLKYVTPYGQVTTEPLVAYVVSGYSDMEYEDGFAGIVVADFLNYIPYYTLGGGGLIVLVLTASVDPDLWTYLLALGGLIGVVLALAIVVLYRRSLITTVAVRGAGGVRFTAGRFSERVRRLFAATHVRERVGGFYETVDLLAADRRAVLVAFVLAHVGMVFLIAPVYLTALALGYHVSFAVVALVVAISKLGALVPTPGGLGGIEATIAAALILVAGLDPAVAVAITLLYRVCTYWFTVAVGGLTAAGLLIRG